MDASTEEVCGGSSSPCSPSSSSSRRRGNLFRDTSTPVNGSCINTREHRISPSAPSPSRLTAVIAPGAAGTLPTAVDSPANAEAKSSTEARSTRKRARSAKTTSSSTAPDQSISVNSKSGVPNRKTRSSRSTANSTVAPVEELSPSTQAIPSASYFSREVSSGSQRKRSKKGDTALAKSNRPSRQAATAAKAAIKASSTNSRRYGSDEGREYGAVERSSSSPPQAEVPITNVTPGVGDASKGTRKRKENAQKPSQLDSLSARGSRISRQTSTKGKAATRASSTKGRRGSGERDLGSDDGEQVLPHPPTETPPTNPSSSVGDGSNGLRRKSRTTVDGTRVHAASNKGKKPSRQAHSRENPTTRASSTGGKRDVSGGDQEIASNVQAEVPATVPAPDVVDRSKGKRQSKRNASKVAQGSSHKSRGASGTRQDGNHVEEGSSTSPQISPGDSSGNERSTPGSAPEPVRGEPASNRSGRSARQTYATAMATSGRSSPQSRRGSIRLENVSDTDEEVSFSQAASPSMGAMLGVRDGSSGGQNRLGGAPQPTQGATPLVEGRRPSRRASVAAKSAIQRSSVDGGHGSGWDDDRRDDDEDPSASSHASEDDMSDSVPFQNVVVAVKKPSKFRAREQQIDSGPETGGRHRDTASRSRQQRSVVVCGTSNGNTNQPPLASDAASPGVVNVGIKTPRASSARARKSTRRRARFAATEHCDQTTREEDLALVLALVQEHEGLLAVRANLRKEVVALQDEEDRLRDMLGFPTVHPVAVPASPPRSEMETAIVPDPAPSTEKNRGRQPSAKSTTRSAASSAEASVTNELQGPHSSDVVSEETPPAPASVQHTEASQPSETQSTSPEEKAARDDDDELEQMRLGSDEGDSESNSDCDVHIPLLSPDRAEQGSTKGQHSGSGSGSRSDNRGSQRKESGTPGGARGRSGGRSRGRGGQLATRGRGVGVNGRAKQPVRFSQLGADVKVKFRPSGRGGASRRGSGIGGGRGNLTSSAAGSTSTNPNGRGVPTSHRRGRGNAGSLGRGH